MYPAVDYVDADGNPSKRPSDEGFPLRVMIQPKAQSGTSARRTENNEEGWFTEQAYRMRVLQDFDTLIDPRGIVEWNGERWEIIGEPILYNGSSRTRHTDYTIRRS